MGDDVPVQAVVSAKGKVTYIYADGRTVTLHGAHPYRDNNPGNLRFPGKDGLERAKRAGAIGIDKGFAIFATGQAGIDALNALIVRRGNEGQTVRAFLGGYAPASENDLPKYILAVTTALKCKESDTLNKLTPAQRGILAETIMRKEGWYSAKNRYSPPAAGRQAPPK